MMDEVVGHMTERVEIPQPDQINITPRKFTTKKPGKFTLYATTEDDLVPEMVKAGDGYRIHTTGLTHDDRGYPQMTVAAQQKMMERLLNKIRHNAHKLVDVRMDNCEGADVVVVSYGISSRIAHAAIDEARAKGLKVGHARLVICWPFPEKLFFELASNVKTFVFPELNMGQMARELERAVQGKAKVISVPHAGGTVHQPQAILDAILEASR
jgi:2-oxoglutarate ferredoxin oxidoreductase subunit alpha